MRTLILSAPQSGSGKTIVSVGLVSALRRIGHSVSVAKSGPDYIDAAYLSAAAERPAVNLDCWAMRPSLLNFLVCDAAGGEDDFLICEGAMGLFDGGAGQAGSTASLAIALGAPVVLIIDASRQAQSVSALALGFLRHDPALKFAGVILNRVGSARHESLLRASLSEHGIDVLGVLPSDDNLLLQSRHLGLVQVGELDELPQLIQQIGTHVGSHIDLTRICMAARPVSFSQPVVSQVLHKFLPPPGQRVAVARDMAFAFSYEHMLTGWRKQGAEVSFFSPLDDAGPDLQADAVFLPGGYPEIYAGRISANRRFLSGLRQAAGRGAVIYGECGGYMVLGAGLIDGNGTRHEMADLLPVETSFLVRQRTLGYRRAVASDAHPFAPGATLRCHEFHYATLTSTETGDLYRMSNIDDDSAVMVGSISGRVAGSFLHVIDIE